MNDIVIFNAVIEREVYNSENFKVYAVAPTTQRDKLVYNKYGNVSICGNIQELSLGMTYTITGKLNKKDGYDVMTIKTPKPKTLEESQRFLYEVITERQADLLLEQYPNIIDMIINDEPVDLSKVKGIKDKTFAKIKAKVEDNFVLMEFIEEFSNYDLTLSMARKLRNKYKTIPRMRQAFNEDPYTALCSISGIGFKKADTLILSNDNNKHMVKSKTRAKACVDYLLGENNTQGNTWIDMDEFNKKFYELAYECMDLLPSVLNDDYYYYDKVNNRLGFARDFLTELFLSNKLKELLNNSIKWDIDTTQYSEVNGFELSDEQQGTLSMMCDYNIGVLVGNAGSGKSASSQAFINMLKDNDKTFTLMTPTGKSAIVLSEYTNEDAGTIHVQLGYNPSNEENPWFYNSDNPLKTDVVIIDEFGMCDIQLFFRVLCAIDTTQTKLLLIGDPAQFNSVGMGNILFDILSSDILPTTQLTKIFRYGEGGILTVATDVRNGKKYLQNNYDMQSFGDEQDYVFIPTSDEYMVNYVKNLYKTALKSGFKPEDIAIATPSKKGACGTFELNKIMQEEFNPYSQGKYSVKSGEQIYRVGDIVIQTVNNYKATDENGCEVKITNGETGKITQITYKEVIVDYGRKVIVYDKTDLSQIDLGYVLTTHKLQGSSAKIVILLSPRANVFMLNKNAIYVGITRASVKCFHLGLPQTINQAVGKSAELTRQTWLKDLLLKMQQVIKK